MLFRFVNTIQADDEAYKALYQSFKKECSEANKLTLEDATQISLGHFSAYTDNNDAKCHIKCMGEKSGFFKDGEYHSDVLVKISEAFGKDPAKVRYQRNKNL